MTYQQLYAAVLEEVPQLPELVAQKSQELMTDETIDTCTRTTRLVEYVHGLWSDKDPIVLVYLTPPYYPHVHVAGEKEKERRLLWAVDKAIEETGTDYKLTRKKFFPYISDLSFATAPQDPEVIRALKRNTPGFGIFYDIPLREMQSLDLPVVDIGPFGKDAHKFTERIEKNYSFYTAPELVYRTVMNLLHDADE